MRSAKDIKGIVAEARGRSKQGSHNSNTIAEDVEGENPLARGPYDTAPAATSDTNYNFVRKGATTFAAPTNDDDTLKKLRKLEVLASADKDTIVEQSKKMHAMRAELEALTTKYAQLKRNYDSVSLHAKKDSA